MRTDSTPELDDAEADFVRRGLSHVDTGALDGGVSGINWILERWRETHPLLSFQAFLREFVAVIGPAARTHADRLGWPDIWHMPMTLVSRDETAKTETYEVDDGVWAAAQANRTHIFDARALEIIERLRWEFRAQPVYTAITADPPYELPALGSPEEQAAYAALAAEMRAMRATSGTEAETRTAEQEPAAGATGAGLETREPTAPIVAAAQAAPLRRPTRAESHQAMLEIAAEFRQASHCSPAVAQPTDRNSVFSANLVA